MNFVQQSLFPVVDENINFWMVRTKKGFFFDEFIQNEFIAIGWNLITKSMVELIKNKTEENSLKEAIKEEYNELKPGTALNKCKRFCTQMKEGDFAIVVGRHKLAIVKIGEYYESKDETLTVDFEKTIHNLIEKTGSHKESFDCPYVKRRKITLIREICENETISPYLQSAISVNLHSISDFNDHAELVLRSCYDAYQYKDKISMTFRVARKDHINALELSEFLISAAKVISRNQYDKIIVKTAINSPGEVSFVFHLNLNDYIFYILCYLLIFGGKIGNIELTPLPDLIKKLIDLFYYPKEKRLELASKQLDNELKTFLIEQLPFALKNHDNQDVAKQVLVEHGKKLIDSANKLEIQASSNTESNVKQLLETLDSIKVPEEEAQSK